MPKFVFRCPVLIILLLAFGVAFSAFGQPCPDIKKDFHHLVIFGDPHLPGKHLAHKERMRKTINGWRDVDLVIAVGDICDEYGTPEEYRAARSFFARLNHPFVVVAGNHDYLYETPTWQGGGGYKPATRAVQEAKLALFRQTFHLPKNYFSKQIGSYLLLFLSTDHENFNAGIGEAQMAWLRDELADNPRIPTIIVFHGPLNGTQFPFKRYINRPNSVAQPMDAIHELITANPQIFIWISGHTHTPATEESFASPVNLYANQVTNIHNADMKRDTIWTNSILLYPDQVVVKTFNHQQERWHPELERRILPPKL